MKFTFVILAQLYALYTLVVVSDIVPSVFLWWALLAVVILSWPIYVGRLLSKIKSDKAVILVTSAIVLLSVYNLFSTRSVPTLDHSIYTTIQSELKAPEVKRDRYKGQ